MKSPVKSPVKIPVPEDWEAEMSCRAVTFQKDNRGSRSSRSGTEQPAVGSEPSSGSFFC